MILLNSRSGFFLKGGWMKKTLVTTGVQDFAKKRISHADTRRSKEMKPLCNITISEMNQSKRVFSK